MKENKIALKFKRVDEDTGNLIYKGSDGNIYVSVDGVIHDVTGIGEPLSPVHNVYIEAGEPIYNPADRFGRNPGSKVQGESFSAGGKIKDGQTVTLSAEKLQKHFKANDTKAGKLLLAQLLEQVNNTGIVLSQTLGTADINFGKKIIKKVPKSILQGLSFEKGGQVKAVKITEEQKNLLKHAEVYLINYKQKLKPSQETFSHITIIINKFKTDPLDYLNLNNAVRFLIKFRDQNKGESELFHKGIGSVIKRLGELASKIRIKELALNFIKELKKDITSDQFKEINEINKQPGNENTCATHDYVDANEYMSDAFVTTFGRLPVFYNDEEPETEAQSYIDFGYINHAWDVAHKAEFDEKRVEKMKIHGLSSFESGGSVSGGSKYTGFLQKKGNLPPEYYKTFTLPKNGRRQYNIFQSHTLGQSKLAARKLFPNLSYREHEQNAAYYFKKYKEQKAKYAETVDRLFLKEFGRKLEFTDYKVSGIYTDEFSREAKDEIRGILNKMGDFRAAYELHNAVLVKADKKFEAGGQVELPEDVFMEGSHDPRLLTDLTFEAGGYLAHNKSNHHGKIQITPYQYYGFNYPKQIVWVDSLFKHPDPLKKMIWGHGENGDTVSDFKKYFEKNGKTIELEYTVPRYSTANQDKMIRVLKIKEYLIKTFEKGGSINDKLFKKTVYFDFEDDENDFALNPVSEIVAENFTLSDIKWSTFSKNTSDSWKATYSSNLELSDDEIEDAINDELTDFGSVAYINVEENDNFEKGGEVNVNEIDVRTSNGTKDKMYAIRTVIDGSDTTGESMSYKEASAVFDDLVTEHNYESSHKDDYATDPNNEDNWIEIVYAEQPKFEKGGLLNNHRRAFISFVNEFPTDAKTWDMATGELPDIHSDLAERYNETAKNKYEFDFERRSETPAIHNIRHGEGIKKLLGMMSEDQINAAYDRWDDMLERFQNNVRANKKYEAGGQVDLPDDVFMEGSHDPRLLNDLNFEAGGSVKKYIYVDAENMPDEVPEKVDELFNDYPHKMFIDAGSGSKLFSYMVIGYEGKIYVLSNFYKLMMQYKDALNYSIDQSDEGFSYEAGGSVTKSRIDKMVDNWNEEGRAFSSLSNNDNEFFERIDTPHSKLGITSQTGNDLVYYDTKMYEDDTAALRKKVKEGSKSIRYLILKSPVKSFLDGKYSKYPYRAVLKLNRAEPLKSVFKIQGSWGKNDWDERKWDNTPGQWYLGTLINAPGYSGNSEEILDSIMIDSGQKWEARGTKAAILEAMKMLNIEKPYASFKKGGSVEPGITRDGVFENEEGWEKRHHRSTRPGDQKLKYEAGGSLATNMDVFGYQSENFDMCHSASEQFKKAIAEIENDKDEESVLYRNQVEALKDAAKQVDTILGIEKILKVSGARASDEQNSEIIDQLQKLGISNAKSGEYLSLDFLTPHIANINASGNKKFEAGGQVNNDAKTYDLQVYDYFYNRGLQKIARLAKRESFTGTLDQAKDKAQQILNTLPKAAYANVRDAERQSVVAVVKVPGINIFEKGGSIEYARGGRVENMENWLESKAQSIIDHYLPGTEGELQFGTLRKKGDYSIDNDEKGDRSKRVSLIVKFGADYSTANIKLDANYSEFAQFIENLAKEKGYNAEILSSDEDQELIFAFSKLRTSKYEAGGDVSIKTAESFELGTPAIHHFYNSKGEKQEETGEVVMNPSVYMQIHQGRTDRDKTYQPGTVKGLSLYRDKNYSGSSYRFTVPNWENTETFAEANKRNYAGKEFEIKKWNFKNGGPIDPDKIYTSEDAREHKDNFLSSNKPGSENKIQQAFATPNIAQFYIHGKPLSKILTNGENDRPVNDFGNQLYQYLAYNEKSRTDALKNWAIHTFIFNKADKNFKSYYFTRDSNYLRFWQQQGLNEDQLMEQIALIRSISSPADVTFKIAYNENQQYNNKYEAGGAVESLVSDGFTIRQMKEYLAKEFPDSFGFTVFPIKEGTTYEPDYKKVKFSTGLSDADIGAKLYFPQYKPNHQIYYEIRQGGENTYFNFLLESKGNYYSGTFGFKDSGDVPAEYITRFLVFLQAAYGLPFQIEHTVLKRGGTINAIQHFDLNGKNFKVGYRKYYKEKNEHSDTVSTDEVYAYNKEDAKAALLSNHPGAIIEFANESFESGGTLDQGEAGVIHYKGYEIHSNDNSHTSLIYKDGHYIKGIAGDLTLTGKNRITKAKEKIDKLFEAENGNKKYYIISNFNKDKFITLDFNGKNLNAAWVGTKQMARLFDNIIDAYDAEEKLDDFIGDEKTLIVDYVTLEQVYEMGGKIDFQQKVTAIAKNLKGKDVPQKFKKIYGKKYSLKDATQSAKNIAGSMLKKGKK